MHKFRIGQSVRFSPGKRSLQSAYDDFRVTRLLPLDGGELTYRIKSEKENFERAAKESEISSGH